MHAVHYLIPSILVTYSVLKGNDLEKTWHNCKFLPHYKYIARPIYKYLTPKTNPVLATVITLFVMDFLMHQVLQQTLDCSLNAFQNCKVTWSPLATLSWLAIGSPVIYAKYIKMNHKNDEVDTIECLTESFEKLKIA